VITQEVTLKLRHLFTINLPIAIFFGLVCALLPSWTLKLYGLTPEDGGIWATRLAGGSILGFATLMWYGRTRAPLHARQAIALALCVQDAIGAIACLEIQLKGSLNALGWSNPVLYALLALSYAWFVFVRPADC
jgi:hypothetical protein